jgi:hypothetical protein
MVVNSSCPSPAESFWVSCLDLLISALLVFLEMGGKGKPVQCCTLYRRDEHKGITPEILKKKYLHNY